MNYIFTTFRLVLRSIIILLLVVNSSTIYSQEFNSTYKLGDLEAIVKPFVDSHLKSIENEQFNLQVTTQKTFTINVQSNTSEEGAYYLFGKVDGFQNATFYLKGDDTGINGSLLFYDNKEAYSLSTNEQKEVFIEKIDIHSLVCIMDSTSVSLDSNTHTTNHNQNEQIASEKQIMPELESFPGAPGVLYLDFDGENVSGGRWGTINASPAGLSNEEIEEIFYIVAEDYAPFNINVTTTRSVFEDASMSSRIMVIYNNTYPSNPGVAYRNSFNDGSGDPCWVRMGGPVASSVKAANVGSHEAGHTFGLAHDGSPAGAYYPGHSFYRVIMGTVTNGYSQFSKGEYANANNSEDDLQIVSGDRNDVGYRTDDYGNDINNSGDLSIGNNGDVLDIENFGIIEKTMDVDFFKMEVGAGVIDLEVRPANAHDFSQNLDVKIRLLDASGTEISNADANGFDASILNETVEEGVYYLEIDGVGSGDPLGNGYSDYGSIGQYFISGKVPPVSLSTSDIENKNKFQIFPNPANGEINIKHNFIQAGYEILTIHGATIINGDFNSDYEKLDVSFLSKGVYLFNVKTDNQIYTSKIIIK